MAMKFVTHFCEYFCLCELLPRSINQCIHIHQYENQFVSEKYWQRIDNAQIPFWPPSWKAAASCSWLSLTAIQRKWNSTDIMTLTVHTASRSAKMTWTEIDRGRKLCMVRALMKAMYWLFRVNGEDMRKLARWTRAYLGYLLSSLPLPARTELCCESNGFHREGSIHIVTPV